jgi:hypothetical protein
MKISAADLDLDAIAKRIELAREVYGDDFALGSVDFASGELTTRATVDVLRDIDRVALFREVRRLRLAVEAAEHWRVGAVEDLHRARQVVREAVDLLTNPETAIDLRDWTRSAERVIRSTES